MDSDPSFSLPHIPYDTLRNGLETLKDTLPSTHPVQSIKEKDSFKERCRTVRELYGIALPARMQIEKQILQRRGRLPPLASSDLGTELFFNEVGRFSVESYLGLEEYSEMTPPDTHSQMEEIVGLQYYPSKRGIP